METPRRPVQLGIVGAAHGIRGEVRVKSFTDDPLDLGRYGPLYTAAGRPLKVKSIRPATTVVVVRFEGIDDRNAAEALGGEPLYVDRSQLPAALEEDEFYHADLIGLAAIDEAGEELGRVIAVHDFGAGDIIELRPPRGPTLMIPFTREAVSEVSLARRTLRVDRKAAGLGEEEQDNAAAKGGEDPGASL